MISQCSIVYHHSDCEALGSGYAYSKRCPGRFRQSLCIAKKPRIVKLPGFGFWVPTEGLEPGLWTKFEPGRHLDSIVSRAPYLLR